MSRRARIRSPYSVGYQSDRGSVREENEDTILHDRDHGAFAVIDGMGGHAGGRMAAELALKQIKAAMKNMNREPETRIREAIAQANRTILDARGRNPQYSEMACVLTLLHVQENVCTVGHVGDTRLYKIHHQRLTPVTEDHSPVGDMVRRGVLTEEQAMYHPNRNLVLRDVGSTPHSPEDAEFVDIYRVAFDPDSALLLASDGLCDQVTPSEILALVRRFARTPQKAADALVARANQAGGKDNVSVVLIAGPQFAKNNFISADDSTARLSEEVPESGGRTAWRWLAVVILLLFLAAAWLVWKRTPPEPTESGVTAWIVDAAGRSGKGRFSSLQAALQAAPAGTVVEVRPGSYLGPITLTGGVTLRAAPGVTLRGAPGMISVVTADRLTELTALTGFTIDAAGARRCLDLRASSVSLKNSTLRGAQEALLAVADSSTVDLQHNTFEPTVLALLVEASTALIRENRFAKAPAANAARAAEFRDIAGNYKVTLERNHFVNCGVSSVVGLAPSQWLPLNTFDPPLPPVPPPGKQ